MLVTIRKMFDLLSKREKIQLYVQFVALVSMAFVEMAGIASILPFMAVVANPGVIRTNRWLKHAYDFFQFSSLQSFLFFLGIVVLGLMVFSNLFKALTTWLTLRYDNRLNYNLARRLLAAYLSRPYEFFLNRNTAEMGKNVLSEARTVIAGILSPGMQLLSSSLLCIFIMAFLMVVDPFVAVAIIVVLGGSYGAIYLVVRRRLVRIGREQVEANTMKFKAASEALSGIKDLKILGRERVFLDRFAAHALRHARRNATVGVISQLPRYALETIAFGGILLIVIYSLESEKDVGKIVPLLSIYAFAGYRLMPALQQIFASISAVRVSLPTLEILHQDMCESPLSADPDVAVVDAQSLKPLPFTQKLVLEGVSFRYAGAQEPAVKEISLTISPNTSIGLVGATGSGKTTTVDIILGLLSPTQGQLLVDGSEVSGDTVANWQRNLGYVPQHIYLCDDTITRNIAFGVPEEDVDMEAVIRAARIANLNEFIEQELPNGFETVIGERGVRLSGGQRQRIGIARALYRNPVVLIMDEATSALDGITEEAVMDALRTLSGEKTIIMIAHRLTTVKDCDIIYHMEHGHIVNQGSYDELLGSSAWFQAAARTGT
ncbi:ABC transporter ATP-binding protein [Oryzomonas sagensis]|uniref:ABC transporter ATP-binding protein n=1 Tax=Oryzomonas sagensis TaxID=2603857 RepID=A0ABQ6TKH2_9BACT|nr:ABC transporter ATP-binding protein [Oryzomonas sagensis]KAB0668521.1 ABC transporter ATP-binding protein [Oryzomonas sagensis]